MDGYTNINDTTCVGCYANVELVADTTYYFRIRGDEYNEMDDLTFVISENPRSDAAHVHSYDSHIWINSTQHESFCICGDSIICGHAVINNKTQCILCGGKADKGFIGPLC